MTSMTKPWKNQIAAGAIIPPAYDYCATAALLLSASACYPFTQRYISKLFYNSIGSLVLHASHPTCRKHASKPTHMILKVAHQIHIAVEAR